MPLIVRSDTSPQIIRRTNINIVIGEQQKIDVPHQGSPLHIPSPASLRSYWSFGRHPSLVGLGGLPPEAAQQRSKCACISPASLRSYWSFGRHPSLVGLGGLPPEAAQQRWVADRVGFEPTNPVKGLRISSAVPSTARPPVRGLQILKLASNGKPTRDSPSPCPICPANLVFRQLRHRGTTCSIAATCLLRPPPPPRPSR
jgi:hypothetical protein